MRCFIQRALYAAGLTAVLTASAIASPVSGQLLPLVPPGCAIVAGFENGHGPHAGGRLLLTTPNNQLDLDDWLALAGVDTGRRYDEVIEAAAPNSTGQLTEHLLLVAGRFDRERIFRAAQQNGAQTSQSEGETVLLVKPFPREQRLITETRWLAIVNNRTALLGSPLLVQQALRRLVTHAEADSVLIERLTPFRPDITSWNLIVSMQTLLPNFKPASPHSVWAHLLEGADVLLVGAHFGSRIRVDFFVNAGNDRETAFLNRKADLFRDMFMPETVQQGELSQRPQPQLENLSVERNEVQGSIQLSDKQFGDWIAHLGHPQAPRETERSTTIAGTN
jgi:hypothetical protein